MRSQALILGKGRREKRNPDSGKSPDKGKWPSSLVIFARVGRNPDQGNSLTTASSRLRLRLAA
jgi:hypothetical protein